MEKLWRNWAVHNIVAHPLMEITRIISFNKLNNLGDMIHDLTLPKPDKQEEEFQCQQCGFPVPEHAVDYGNCIQCMHD